jgi:hypothetical protein
MAMCANGMETSQGMCSGTGTGTCNAGMSTSCGAYMCNAGGTACLTNCMTNGDADCAMGNYCQTSNHTCVATLGPGMTCTAPDQCTSKMCSPSEGGMICM